MYSKEIERFMKILKQSKADFSYHYEIVGKKDKETQDLLHELELGKYENRSKTATKLAKVRKERRVAKDIVEITEPIVNFLNENKKLYDQLGQLLGLVRKVEKSHQGRVYKPRIRNDLTIRKE